MKTSSDQEADLNARLFKIVVNRFALTTEKMSASTENIGQPVFGGPGANRRRGGIFVSNQEKEKILNELSTGQ